MTDKGSVSSGTPQLDMLVQLSIDPLGSRMHTRVSVRLFMSSERSLKTFAPSVFNRGATFAHTVMKVTVTNL